MSAALLAALLASRPEPYRIDLVNITVDDARTLQGKRVKVSFVTGCPSYSLNGVTVTGPGDQDADGDAVSRGVVLRGETIIDRGERVDVVGQLWVIDRAPVLVNGMLVPGWVEVRVEEE